MTTSITTENVLIEILISTLTSGLTSLGITVGIEQSYQPVQQGIPTADSIFIFLLHSHRFGSPKRTDVWDSDSMQMNHSELQVWEATYQFNALATQNPNNPSPFTANDYLKAASSVLQSEAGINSLKALQVEIQRITNIRHTFFKNDRDQFQADPSFDVTVSYGDTVTSVINSGTLIVPTIFAT